MGCGQIGSRHLQAVSSLPHVREIEVVDSRPDALALGRQRLAEVPDRQPSTKYKWLPSIDEASDGGDLCIVATQAKGRCQLVRQIADALGYSGFLLEKVVSQSAYEYEDLMQFTEDRGISAWVNCKSRAYPFHKRVKQLLDPSEPIIFSVVGGNHGLANNGIHAADLFAFYDEAGCIESAGSHIDPVLHPSRRGNGVYDLSGALHGYTEKGSYFTLFYGRDHEQWEHISIGTRRYRCVIDHLKRTAYESDEASGWEWRQVPEPLDDGVLISHMTRQFASDILSSGCCELPTLEECAVAHRFMLGELQPHFSRLLDKEAELCPVT